MSNGYIIKEKQNHLNRAKKVKDDEFYTRLEDIEKELGLAYYRDSFYGKVIYCNCDDYRISNFVRYFKDNFHLIGISRLIATCYKDQTIDFFNFNDDIERGIHYEYDGTNESITYLDGDGSYRSDECLELLKQCDIVVTNPPFSIFKKYFDCLINYNKQFIIIGNLNAVKYKNIIYKLSENKVSVGYNFIRYFIKDLGIGQSISIWFNNLSKETNKEFIPLDKYYNDSDYYVYYNVNSLFIKYIKDIPKNYRGLMAVPINFIMLYNSNQFQILGTSCLCNEFINIRKIKVLTPAKSIRIVPHGLLKYNSSLHDNNNIYKDLSNDTNLVFPYERIIIKNKILL